MKKMTCPKLIFALLAFAGPGAARADKQTDANMARLNASLSQLASDPVLGKNATAEQARAHDAIYQLGAAKRSERAHALFIADRRVELAKTIAALQDAQAKIAQLDHQHDQMMLESSQRELDAARRELDRQRQQFAAAQAEAARLQEQGQAAQAAATQAKAEADQARRLATAQSRLAKAAKQQAELAAKTAKALRSQIENDDSNTPQPSGDH